MKIFSKVMCTKENKNSVSQQKIGDVAPSRGRKSISNIHSWLYFKYTTRLDRKKS